MSERPAILIAATHSGAGKTTVTGVVCRALRRRGLVVQPFKLGPDFIDPGYRREATGCPSINLDVWMMGEDGVRRSYERWSSDADVCVIESMGALYDGDDGTEHGSAAHVAKLLGIPVIVVLDASGMTRTAAAILDGLRGFDPEVNIAGCILNRVGGETHRRMIVDALPSHLRGMVVGAIERRRELEVPERHLGLITVEENPLADATREEVHVRAAELIDLDRIVRIAGCDRPPSAKPRIVTRAVPVARLAVARDDAFSFYYEENLLLLSAAGFELVPFRPTRDSRLPAGTDAVYIGGGYPESFAAILAANVSLASELRERTRAGIPLYAECGGLIYLSRSLAGFDGVRHELSNVLPLDVAMDPNYLAISYVEAHTRTESPLGETGTTVRGQEFHQSRIVHADIDPTLYDLTTSSGEERRGGYLLGNVVASYVHLHFASNPRIVDSLLQTAIANRAP